MREFNNALNALIAWEMLVTLVSLAFMIFFMWLFYVYVTSRREWFENDIHIRNGERSYHLARAEQIRLESLALKSRLSSNGIDVNESKFDNA